MAVNTEQLQIDYDWACIELTRLRGLVSMVGDLGYKVGYVVGAAKYGGVIIRPEDVEVPSVSER